MRFFYIAMTAALAATAIAAPMPEEDLHVGGGGKVGISGKRDEDLHIGAGAGVSASGKRDAGPEKALHIGADGKLVVNLKRDSVSAELAKLLEMLKNLLSKRDAIPDEDLSVSGDASVSAEVKREQFAAAAAKDLVVNADGSITLGLKRDTQSVSVNIEKLIKELEKVV